MFKKPGKRKTVATSKSTSLPQFQSNDIISMDGSQSQSESVQASAIGSTHGTSDTRTLPEPEENPADDTMPSSNKDDENREADEDPLVTSLKKRLRTTRSPVWDEFERDVEVRCNKKHVREAVVLGTCNHCKKVIDAGSQTGTTRLSNHLKTCRERPQNKAGQQQITASLKTAGNKAVKLANYKYDPAISREYMAKMIAKHDYPLNMAQHFYFRMFCKSLNPAAKIMCRNTTRSDVMKFFHEEKQELQLALDNLTSRCSLTTDMWTSKHTKDGYCCVTCHYIEDEWNLVKKTLAYILVPSPHTGDVLTECIKTCTLEWNIDRKFLALTADNAAANGVMMRNLIRWLESKDCLVLDGKLFHMRCANHILHLVVLDGMKVAAKFVQKIRDCVKYVKSSQARKERFELAVSQVRLSGKAVSLDVDTRWNSTYVMLKNAIELRIGFERLAVLDPEFECLPSADQWQQGVVICACLEVFNDVSTRFAGMKYPTANLYYNGVYEVNKCIKQWEYSDYEYIREMGLKMREKFDAYWLDSNLVMSIGVVLDPRYKARWVEFRYKKMYGSSGYAVEYNKFKTQLTALFNAYESQNSNADEHYFGARSSVSSSSMIQAI